MSFNLFYVFSFMAIFSSLLMIFARKPVYSVIFLIITFIAISGIYILLNAQFLAIVNIIVYSGAVMVLFLFVLMMLNLNNESEPDKKIPVKLLAIITGAMLLFTLTIALIKAEHTPIAPLSDIGLVEKLGKELFTTYVVPFEISSILFIAAMVGAVKLALRDKSSETDLPNSNEI